MSILFKVKKVLSNLANPRYFTANRHLVLAATEHQCVLRSLKCKSVIDAGANRGQFALVARAQFPDCRIFSFEPLAGPRSVLKKLFSRDNYTVIYDCALGENEGDCELHISKRDDSSSLLKISTKQSEYFPGTEEVGTVRAQVKRLDTLIEIDCLPEPVLLKIDVQGGELEVLKGAQGIFNKIKNIYVEASFVELYEGQALAHQVITFLNSFNYKLDGVYNVSYDKSGIAIQADFLFTKITP